MKKTELAEIIKYLTKGRSFVRVEATIWHNARTIVLFNGYDPRKSILSLMFPRQIKGFKPIVKPIDLLAREIKGLEEVAPEDMLTFFAETRSFLF